MLHMFSMHINSLYSCKMLNHVRNVALQPMVCLPVNAKQFESAHEVKKGISSKKVY